MDGLWGGVERACPSHLGLQPAPSSHLSDELFPGTGTITNSPTHTGKDDASGDIGHRKWVGLSRAKSGCGRLSLSLSLVLSLSVSLVST